MRTRGGELPPPPSTVLPCALLWLHAVKAPLNVEFLEISYCWVGCDAAAQGHQVAVQHAVQKHSCLCAERLRVVHHLCGRRLMDCHPARDVVFDVSSSPPLSTPVPADAGAHLFSLVTPTASTRLRNHVFFFVLRQK